MASKFNNFQFLRIAAATSVIFSHSFLLADGNELAEPLAKILGDKNVLGIYGVFIFFFISGFLITNSALHSRSIASFLTKRFLRIYPALGACAFLSAAIFGSMFTERTLSDFWHSLAPFRYTWGTLKNPLEGWHVNSVVFPYDGQHWLRESMNGSLWTIGQEINLYIIVGVLATLGLLTMRWVVATLFFGAVLWASAFAFSLLDFGQRWHFLFLAPSFAAGSACYFIRERWGLDGRIALAIAAVLPLFALADLFKAAFIIAAYPVLWLATTDRFKLPTFELGGDFSYGMYLWGWPLGQLMVTLLAGQATPTLVFLATLPAAIGIGILSWFLVEARAMALAPTIEQKAHQIWRAMQHQISRLM